ncbi:hypothetical protein ACQ0MK_12000 [Thalassospira lucentensis]|uniref:hypothetical protein n=1 Tax=Thalassospira lucentensis TaxID=168935 RepID=UPI003D2F0B52
MSDARTTQKTVTFAHPFHLKGFKDLFPAGSYMVETTEKMIESLSFTAYRRVATDLHLKAKLNGMMVDRILNIVPIDLDFALAQDADPKHPQNLK